MKWQPDFESVIPIEPHGTNSTMFTRCCGVAICDDQTNCPKCGIPIVGYDAKTPGERGRIRWRWATAHWKRKKRS